MIRIRRPLRPIVLAVLVVVLASGAIAATGITLAMSEADAALQKARTLALPDPEHDRTAEFLALHNGGAPDLDGLARRLSEAGRPLPDTRFLIVPGYLTDFLDVPQSLGLVEHFGGQLAALRDAGFDVEIVDIESEASVEKGAALLRAAVEAEDGPVCLISHSKGGLDTLEFLIHADAQVREQIVCWIALQAPFSGSPVADGVASQDLLRWPSEAALELFGGDGQSLHDQRMDIREDYLDEHAGEIAEIVAQIPILSVAGRVDDVRLTSKHAFIASWLNDEDIANDGMVPTWSSVLLGSNYIIVDGLDHTGVVLEHLLAKPIDRVAVTTAMLIVAFENSENFAGLDD